MASIDIDNDIASNVRLSDLTPAATTAKSAESLPKPPTPSALEPFLLLLDKTVRGNTGVSRLVLDLVAAKGVFVFGEMLDRVEIKELRNHDETKGHYRVLEIFAYGDWMLYQAESANLPKLNDNAIKKLKHLTIVSLMRQSRTLSYSLLLSLLSIPPPETSNLESLLIEGIYSGLFSGRLDQKKSRLELDWAIGRDVILTPSVTNTNSISHLHSSLQNFENQLQHVLQGLDNHISSLVQAEKYTMQVKEKHGKELERLAGLVADKSGSGGGGGGGGKMDLDEDNGRRGGGRSGYGGMMSGLGGGGGASRQRKRTRP